MAEAFWLDLDHHAMESDLMFRCISVNPMALHNVSFGEDNITSMHDLAEASKEGTKSVHKTLSWNSQLLHKLNNLKQHRTATTI